MEGLANFPISVFECNVCYNVPSSKDHFILCKRGHVLCKNCRSRLEDKCPTCSGEFNQDQVTVLNKILDVIEMDCKFKDIGCSSRLKLDNKLTHEDECTFRKTCKFDKEGCTKEFNNLQTRIKHQSKCTYRSINCFNSNCQKSGGVQISRGIIGKGLINHYTSHHPRNPFAEIEIENANEFQINGLDLKLLTFKGQNKYVFVGRFGIDEIKNTRKACLITFDPPEVAKKFKCNLILISDGNEVFNNKIKVISIDDMESIHSWKSGGLIYPVDFTKSLGPNISFKVKVFQEARPISCTKIKSNSSSTSKPIKSKTLTTYKHVETNDTVVLNSDFKVVLPKNDRIKALMKTRGNIINMIKYGTLVKVEEMDNRFKK